jgi:hypothetical protein
LTHRKGVLNSRESDKSKRSEESGLEDFDTFLDVGSIRLIRLAFIFSKALVELQSLENILLFERTMGKTGYDKTFLFFRVDVFIKGLHDFKKIGTEKDEIEND